MASIYSDDEAPDRAGGVLHPPEDVVQAQVVSHCILPAVRIVTVKCESIGKPKNHTENLKVYSLGVTIFSPGVYFIEVHLPPGGLCERLLDEGGVGEGRPHLLAPVELPVGGQVMADVAYPVKMSARVLGGLRAEGFVGFMKRSRGGEG